MNWSVSIVQPLLESGADVKAKNAAKKSALDNARKFAEQARSQETADWKKIPSTGSLRAIHFSWDQTLYLPRHFLQYQKADLVKRLKHATPML